MVIRDVLYGRDGGFAQHANLIAATGQKARSLEVQPVFYQGLKGTQPIPFGPARADCHTASMLDAFSVVMLIIPPDEAPRVFSARSREGDARHSPSSPVCFNKVFSAFRAVCTSHGLVLTSLLL